MIKTELLREIGTIGFKSYIETSFNTDFKGICKMMNIDPSVFMLKPYINLCIGSTFRNKEERKDTNDMNYEIAYTHTMILRKGNENIMTAAPNIDINLHPAMYYVSQMFAENTEKFIYPYIRQVCIHELIHWISINNEEYDKIEPKDRHYALENDCMIHMINYVRNNIEQDQFYNLIYAFATMNVMENDYMFKKMDKATLNAAKLKLIGVMPNDLPR